jgi:hypothetical protein
MIYGSAHFAMSRQLITDTPLRSNEEPDDPLAKSVYQAIVTIAVRLEALKG